MKPLIGTDIDRVDGVKKVTGRATYAAEVQVANVAHAVIVGPGHADRVAADQMNVLGLGGIGLAHDREKLPERRHAAPPAAVPASAPRSVIDDLNVERLGPRR